MSSITEACLAGVRTTSTLSQEQFQITVDSANEIKGFTGNLNAVAGTLTKEVKMVSTAMNNAFMDTSRRQDVVRQEVGVVSEQLKRYEDSNQKALRETRQSVAKNLCDVVGAIAEKCDIPVLETNQTVTDGQGE